MRERGWSQQDLAQITGRAQQTVSYWVSSEDPTKARVPQDWRIVFELEDKMGLPPGYLSSVLGFYPAVGSDVVGAIMRDPLFSSRPMERETVLSVYRNMAAILQSGTSRRATRAT